jgi:hypothetical protein
MKQIGVKFESPSALIRKDSASRSISANPSNRMPPRLASQSSVRQRLVEIGDQVGRVFEPDRQAEGSFTGPVMIGVRGAPGEMERGSQRRRRLIRRRSPCVIRRAGSAAQIRAR